MPVSIGDHLLQLPGGRRLAFAVYGEPAGEPVLNCHGGLVSGHDVAPAHELARSMGVAVISPHRPGVGGTDRLPGYDMATWVEADLRPLLDHLEVERFGAMGWSEGGQYALAACHRVPDRATACAVIAGCPPLDDPLTLRESNRLDWLLAVAARRAPWAVRVAFTGARLLARSAPGALVRAATVGLPGEEKKAVRAAGRWFGTVLAEGSADPDAVVDEYRAAVSQWGFDPEDLDLPVRVFQGTDDTMVPERWGRELARRIPGAELTLYPGEGHFIALTRRREVLQWLLDQARSSTNRSQPGGGGASRQNCSGT